MRWQRLLWRTRAGLLSTFVAVALAAHPARASAQTPAGWLLTGEDADRYELVLDAGVARSGSASKRIAAKGNRRKDDWAVSLQMVDATGFRGQRIRLSGYLRSEDVGSGGLWMRIDGIQDREAAQIALDNTENRRLKDTNDWTLQEIVLDVPPQSVTILFGAMIVGDGALWIDDLSIEPVSTEIEVTAEVDPVLMGGEYSRPPGVLPTPSNLDFERNTIF